MYQYRALVAAGERRPDPDQAAAAERLDDLAVQMAAMQKRRGFVARLLGTGAPPPRGLYLWGSVGRGKSMLMALSQYGRDFGANSRILFHAFRLRVLARLRYGRPKNSGKKEN